MTPDVVDGDQGLAQRHGSSLGEVHTHQHRTDEARRIRHRHGIDIGAGQTGLSEGFVSKTVDGLHMLARCDLGYHAAVDPVLGDLGCDAVHKALPSVPDDGDSSLVTAGFHC